MVGANPNLDLQIQYSQGFQPLEKSWKPGKFGFGFYLQITYYVFEFGLRFAGGGFVPTSGRKARYCTLSILAAFS